MRRMVWLTAGWVRCSLAAAREKLRSRATVRNVRSAAMSIITSYYIVMIITLTCTRATGDNCSMSHDSERVIIFDTTLRDGEQAPGFSLSVAAKVDMARALDALGVDVIEAGFPIASPADAEAVRQVSRDVRRPVIAALARCRARDIEEAARALGPAERPRLHTFLATSDLHLASKLRMTHEE